MIAPGHPCLSSQNAAARLGRGNLSGGCVLGAGAAGGVDEYSHEHSDSHSHSHGHGGFDHHHDDSVTSVSIQIDGDMDLNMVRGKRRSYNDVVNAGKFPKFFHT